MMTMLHLELPTKEYTFGSLGSPDYLINDRMWEMSDIDHPLKEAWSYGQHRLT